MEPINLKKLYEKVEELLPKHRFKHVLGVVSCAKELAENYNQKNLNNIYKLNLVEVEASALLHDIAKYMNLETLHSYINDVKTLEYYGDLGELLHGFAGSNFAKKELNITNNSILNAIKYHTVGCRNMSTLDKIIYIADAIEPNREYPFVGEIREKADISIDEAILFEVECKLKYLLKIGAVIHPNTIDMRNQLLEDKKKLLKNNS